MAPIGARRGGLDGRGFKLHSLLLRTLQLLLLTIGLLLPASADLVFYPVPLEVNGTGLGNTTRVLSFDKVGTGPDMAASGSVCWGFVTSVLGDHYGTDCRIPGLLGMQDIRGSQTVTPGDISALLTPFSLAIILDASEGGGRDASITVSQLFLRFYAPANPDPLAFDVIYSAQLTNSTFIANPSPGAGSSGNVFGLNWAQAVEAQNFISGSGYTFDQVRIGLGAELQQFDGAHAYFWIGNIPGLVPEPPIPPSEVPEPATFLMFGGGLLALGLANWRFRRN